MCSVAVGHPVTCSPVVHTAFTSSRFASVAQFLKITGNCAFAFECQLLRACKAESHGLHIPWSSKAGVWEKSMHTLPQISPQNWTHCRGQHEIFSMFILAEIFLQQCIKAVETFYICHSVLSVRQTDFMTMKWENSAVQLPFGVKRISLKKKHTLCIVCWWQLMKAVQGFNTFRLSLGRCNSV